MGSARWSCEFEWLDAGSIRRMLLDPYMLRDPRRPALEWALAMKEGTPHG